MSWDVLLNCPRPCSLFWLKGCQVLAKQSMDWGTAVSTETLPQTGNQPVQSCHCYVESGACSSCKQQTRLLAQPNSWALPQTSSPPSFPPSHSRPCAHMLSAHLGRAATSTHLKSKVTVVQDYKMEEIKENKSLCWSTLVIWDWNWRSLFKKTLYNI